MTCVLEQVPPGNSDILRFVGRPGALLLEQELERVVLGTDRRVRWSLFSDGTVHHLFFSF